MREVRFGFTPVGWLLAVVLLGSACGLCWLWMGATTSASDCTTGSGGSDLAWLVLAGLVLLTPVGICLEAWRTRTLSRYIVPALVVVTMVAGFAVFFTGMAWWSSHNCMT